MKNINLSKRAKNIILHPQSEWEVIESENTTTIDLYKHYIIPLAAIGPMAYLFAVSFSGINVPFVGNYRVPLARSIPQAVVSYVLILVGVYVLALIIDTTAPKFDGERDSAQAFKVAAYSYTPAWLAGIFNLIPALGVIVLIGSLYVLYLLYLGLPVLMKVPQGKALRYTTVVVLAALVIFFVITLISSVFINVPTPEVPADV